MATLLTKALALSLLALHVAVQAQQIPANYTARRTSSCPIVKLDFNELENPAWKFYNQGQTLETGDYLFDQLWFKYGVRVSARVRDTSIYQRRFDSKIFIPQYDRARDDWVQIKNDTVPGDITTGGAIRLFDTAFPTGNDGQPLCSGDDGDDDLGAPNERCPSPGPGKCEEEFCF